MMERIPDKPNSAVLIPLVEIDGEPHILFEKRSEDIDFQPGDVCFPGGHMESGETAMDAMIRETCEELLIEPFQIADICDFGVFRGPYGTKKVAAFTGRLLGYDFSFSKDESADVFSVPLSWLLSQDYRADAPEFSYRGYYIWGFTARLLCVYLSSPTGGGARRAEGVS